MADIQTTAAPWRSCVTLARSGRPTQMSHSGKVRARACPWPAVSLSGQLVAPSLRWSTAESRSAAPAEGRHVATKPQARPVARNMLQDA